MKYTTSLVPPCGRKSNLLPYGEMKITSYKRQLCSAESNSFKEGQL